MPRFLNGATKVAAVKQDDRGGDEVERCRAGLLAFQATIARPAKPVEGDRTGSAVAGLALVQLGAKGATQRRMWTAVTNWAVEAAALC